MWYFMASLINLARNIVEVSNSFCNPFPVPVQLSNDRAKWIMKIIFLKREKLKIISKLETRPMNTINFNHYLHPTKNYWISIQHKNWAYAVALHSDGPWVCMKACRMTLLFWYYCCSRRWWTLKGCSLNKSFKFWNCADWWWSGMWFWCINLNCDTGAGAGGEMQRCDRSPSCNSAPLIGD